MKREGCASDQACAELEVCEPQFGPLTEAMPLSHAVDSNMPPNGLVEMYMQAAVVAASAAAAAAANTARAAKPGTVWSTSSAATAAAAAASMMTAVEAQLQLQSHNQEVLGMLENERKQAASAREIEVMRMRIRMEREHATEFTHGMDAIAAKAAAQMAATCERAEQAEMRAKKIESKLAEERECCATMDGQLRDKSAQIEELLGLIRLTLNKLNGNRVRSDQSAHHSLVEKRCCGSKARGTGASSSPFFSKSPARSTGSTGLPSPAIKSFERSERPQLDEDRRKASANLFHCHGGGGSNSGSGCGSNVSNNVSKIAGKNDGNIVISESSKNGNISDVCGEIELSVGHNPADVFQVAVNHQEQQDDEQLDNGESFAGEEALLFKEPRYKHDINGVIDEAPKTCNDTVNDVATAIESKECTEAPTELCATGLDSESSSGIASDEERAIGLQLNDEVERFASEHTLLLRLHTELKARSSAQQEQVKETQKELEAARERLRQSEQKNATAQKELEAERGNGAARYADLLRERDKIKKGALQLRAELDKELETVASYAAAMAQKDAMFEAVLASFHKLEAESKAAPEEALKLAQEKHELAREAKALRKERALLHMQAATRQQCLENSSSAHAALGKERDKLRTEKARLAQQVDTLQAELARSKAQSLIHLVRHASKGGKVYGAQQPLTGADADGLESRLNALSAAAGRPCCPPSLPPSEMVPAPIHLSPKSPNRKVFGAQHPPIGLGKDCQIDGIEARSFSWLGSEHKQAAGECLVANSQLQSSSSPGAQANYFETMSVIDNK